MQDIDAHGQIGRGKAIPQHVFGKKELRKVDNIDYVWKKGSRTKVVKNLSRIRLSDTGDRTRNYLNYFVKRIGGESKI